MRAKYTFAAFLLLLSLGASGPVGADELPQPLQQLSRKYVEPGGAVHRQALAAYLEKAPSPELQGFARLALGLGDYFAKDYERAADALQQAPQDQAHFGDYARYYRARSLAEAENFAGAAWLVSDFAQLYADSRLLPDAIRLRVESLIRAEHPDKAGELLEQKPSRLAEPVRLYLLARVHELSGRLREAVEHYRRVYYFHPLSDQAVEAETRLNGLRSQMGSNYPAAPAAWRLARGNRLFDARRYSDAWPEYNWASQGLEGKDLDHALVSLGATDYHRMRTTSADNHLRSLRVSDAGSDARRLYYLVECARRRANEREFERRLAELAEKHAKSPWYEEALFSLGNYYLLENDRPRYGKYYELAARSFPAGKYAALAHWKVGWRAYLERDPRAAALLEEHFTLYPESPQASAAIYWRARLAEKDKDTGLARNLYAGIDAHFPHYYYALLARQRLEEIGLPQGDANPRAVRFLENLSPYRSLASEPRAETSRLIRRGRLLFELGFDDFAEKELATGDWRGSDGHWVGLELARQMAARDAHHRGLRYMKRYGYGYLRMPFDAMPRAFWERLYPLPWGEALQSRAARLAIDPYVVAGLIRQESEFDPRARSRSGALGLMQIMPATGRGLARQLGIQRFSTRQLFRPELSLQLGTHHLKEVVSRNQGELEVSLAAYNAGEHRTKVWIEWDDFDEPGKFVETIPFTETRGYVQSVLRNADLYRRLYADSPRASVARSRDAEN